MANALGAGNINDIVNEDPHKVEEEKEKGETSGWNL
jgi:hypothetical protein